MKSPAIKRWEQRDRTVERADKPGGGRFVEAAASAEQPRETGAGFAGEGLRRQLDQIKEERLLGSRDRNRMEMRI
ncbi:MAG: hypothetical protein KA453_17545, partial [Nitrospira sp.]|nr:hypothetical protein [Nitrospira sp.]